VRGLVVVEGKMAERVAMMESLLFAGQAQNRARY